MEKRSIQKSGKSKMLELMAMLFLFISWTHITKIIQNTISDLAPDYMAEMTMFELDKNTCLVLAVYDY